MNKYLILGVFGLVLGILVILGSLYILLLAATMTSIYRDMIVGRVIECGRGVSGCIEDINELLTELADIWSRVLVIVPFTGLVLLIISVALIAAGRGLRRARGS